MSDRVLAVRRSEHALNDMDAYRRFGQGIDRAKHAFLKFLIGAKETGKSVVGYGAPAKGNTLLNYCGVKPDLVDYTVDRNPRKQGLFLPGSRIPIFAPERILQTRPDFVLILPWNIQNEIVAAMADIRDWGGRFVVPIPTTRIL